MIHTLRSAAKSKYFPFIILFLSILLAAVWYLAPNQIEFPMDDTYIHFVYARNLAETGNLFFNIPGEAGVGSTSILWVLLLAGGYRLGVSVHLAAKILGLVGLFFIGFNLYQLLKETTGEKTALAAALLVVLSGHMLWFSLSGMETILFLMLGLFALRFYMQARWGLLGIALGLQALSRPEGLVLALILGIAEIVRRRRIPKGLVWAGGLTMLIAGPWFVYLLARTGEILPTSAVGKQLSMAISVQYALSQQDSISFLGRFPALTFLGMWVVYLLEFVLGGASLPGPAFSIQTSISNITYRLSYWAVLGWLTALAPISWYGLRKLVKAQPWKLLARKRMNPIVLLLLWVLGHNLLYMIVLPNPGTASRYGALNHILLWTALVVITSRLVSNRRYQVFLGVWILITAFSNTIYWNRVYDANLEHMQNVRIEAAAYLLNQIAPEDLCGVSDIGAIRFFSNRQIFDLGGLVDPHLGDIYLDGVFPKHIFDHGVRCLIVPGRAGAQSDGYLDFAEIMGVNDTPYFAMEEIQVFEIERERWLTGYLPTMNYQATVTVYRLDYLK